VTEAPSWRAYVEAMVEKAQARQDDIFYRLALPGWQAELRRLKGGDDLTPEMAIDNFSSSASQGATRL
jgi:hypothetical protein